MKQKEIKKSYIENRNFIKFFDKDLYQKLNLKLVLKEHNDIKPYLRKVKTIKKTGEELHSVFNMETIYDTNHFMALLMSPRGTYGKTTQAKWLAKKLYDEKGIKTLWTMNSQILVEKEIKNALVKPVKYLENYKNMNNEDNMVLGDMVLLAEAKNKNSWFLKYTGLSTAENEKGSRNDYGLMIIDEFNVGESHIKYRQGELIGSLLGTLSDPVNTGADFFKKLLVFGNEKSLNHEFLINLGIFKFSDGYQVSEISIAGKLNGKKFETPWMLILRPNYSEEKILNMKMEMLTDPKALAAVAIGQAGHIYFNQTLDNNLHNVNQWMQKLDPLKFGYVKTKNMILKWSLLETETTGRIIYFKDVDEIDKDVDLSRIIAFKNRYLEEGVEIDTFDLKEEFIIQLKHQKLYFWSKNVRAELLDSIT